ALVQDLPLLALLVRQQQLAVDRVVPLPERRVDLRRREERVHAEGPRLVGDDRHETRPEILVLHEVLEQPDERHRRRDLLLARSLAQVVVRRIRGQGEWLRTYDALRQEATERLAALLHVRDLVGA